MGRANVAERRTAELAERVEALSELLRAAEMKAKREAARAASYRERLTRPQGGGAGDGAGLNVSQSFDATGGFSFLSAPEPSTPQLPSASPQRASQRLAVPTEGGGGSNANGRAALLRVIQEKEDEVHTMKASLAKYKYLVASAQKRALSAEAELAVLKDEPIPDEAVAEAEAAAAAAGPKKRRELGAPVKIPGRPPVARAARPADDAGAAAEDVGAAAEGEPAGDVAATGASGVAGDAPVAAEPAAAETAAEDKNGDAKEAPPAAAAEAPPAAAEAPPAAEEAPPAAAE